MNINGLLERIGIENLPSDPLERLKLLHRSFACNIPFENIAILEGRTISLELPDLEEKIIRNGRGGYCYELNFLFAATLESLGYDFERLIGRVWVGDRKDPAITHMALRVNIDGQKYLCDVGFGAGLLEPMPWQMGIVTEQLADTFRLTVVEFGEIEFAGLKDGDWARLYTLLECPVRIQDYRPANYYTSTSPDSHFTQRPISAIRTPNGSIFLRGRLFFEEVDGVETVTELSDYEEFAHILTNRFNLRNINHKALQQRLGKMFE